MPGIFPETVNGGLPYRAAAGGACSIPASVQNAYCPDPVFTTTCDLTALPSDCTARITAAQINAIVSEMISFAECLSPAGTWTCTSIRNLCTAFTAWRNDSGLGTLYNDIGRIGCGSPVIAVGIDTSFLVCDGAGNLSQTTPGGFAVGIPDDVTIGGDGSNATPYALIPAGAVTAICASSGARTALLACLNSEDADNAIFFAASDGGLKAISHSLHGTLSANLPSLTALPTGADTVMFAQDFNIPNTSNVAIMVAVRLKLRLPIIVDRTQPAAAGAWEMTANLYPSPSSGGISVSAFRVAGSDPDVVAAGAVAFDHFETGVMYVSVPAGGRTISADVHSRNISALMTAKYATGASSTIEVQWHGVFADSLN